MINLDNNTYYSCIKNDILIIKQSESVETTKQDLINFYKNNKTNLIYDKCTGFVLDKGKDLIFIPVTNRYKIVIEYGITNYHNYDKIKKHKFSLYTNKCGNKYLKSSKTHQTLHEIIHGKKAEKGGWKQLYENAKNNTNKNIIWITNLSGRSLDKNDPNPQMRNFLYYNNDEYIIKVKFPNKHSNWFKNSKIQECPSNDRGEYGMYYKSNSNKLYYKVPTYFIDHINLNGLDNRSTNLREITASANSINHDKKPLYVSIYKGVYYKPSIWVGQINCRGKRYCKKFDNEKDAAKFYDFYLFALYGVYVKNNGMLKEEEINNLLLFGESSIDLKFRVKTSKTLPKCIFFDGGKYRCRKIYKNKSYGKSFDTLDEAIVCLESIMDKINVMKKKTQNEIIENNKHNIISDKYAYIESRDVNGIVNGKFKINYELWNKFVLIKWSYNKISYCFGNSKYLHYHVFKHYNKTYDKLKHGTIDHISRDIFDCTIENLRCIMSSGQSHNVERDRVLKYKGVSLAGCKFKAYFNWKNQTFMSSHIYLEDAAIAYNNFAINIWKGASLNEVPKLPGYLKTTVEDLFHRSNLTEEKINNIKTRSEICTILLINNEWKREIGCTSIRNINVKDINKYVCLFLSLIKQPEVNENIEDTFYKNNLTFEIIKKIKCIQHFKYIFKSNSDWKRREGVEISKMRKKDLEFYRNKVLRLLKEEDMKNNHYIL